jgi:hypothetical protein
MHGPEDQKWEHDGGTAGSHLATISMFVKSFNVYCYGH